MENQINLFVEAEKFGMFLIGKRKPLVFEAFLNLAHEIMHPESSFDQLTRELLGAYVSKKFGCSFCHLGHLETAGILGGDEVKLLVDNPTPELQLLFSIADKVIANEINEKVVADFISNGYTEKHYEDIVFVCALFGFANRMVTGFRIEYNPKRDESSSKFLARGYKLSKFLS